MQVTAPHGNPAPSDDVVDKPRIITLTKGDNGGLGFNIIGGEEEVGIFISVISPEGAAADNGELKVGDMILQVNGEDINGWSHETAAQALKTAGNVVTLKVVYKPEGISLGSQLSIFISCRILSCLET